MSAQKATSELTVERAVGSGKKRFYTITTYENSKPTNTEIKMSIDDDTYASYQSQGGIAAELSNMRDGKAYITVRNGGIDTIYADLDVRKVLADTGSTSLTSVLNDRSIKALTSQFTEDQQGSKPSFWAPYYSTKDNVAVSPEPETTEIATNYAIDEIAVKGRRRKEYENLFYPEDIGKTGQDTIKFSILERKPKGNISSGGGRTDPATRTQAAVVLPIPGNLSDQNNVSYKESSLNALQLAGAEDLISSLTDDGGKLGQNITKVLGTAVGSNNETVKAALAAKATSSALNIPGGLNALLSRTQGTILNPNMELLFSSPTLRSFGFVFKLSPRSDGEAKTVIAIIRFFKQSMVPKVKEGNLFLQSPSSFKVEYMHRGTEGHPGLNKFKECALENCQVNYTPEGTYNTMRDGIMPSYELSLRFRELDPVYSNDYDQQDADAKGGGFATFRTDAAENRALQNRIGDSGIGF